MRNVATEALARFVRDDVLARPERHDWSLQGFGMLRTYLMSKRMRLHIWDSRFRVAGVSDVHDHPWDFESIVLQGRMRNTRFKELPSPAPHWSDSAVPVLADGAGYYERGRILCGPAPMTKGAEEVTPVYLYVEREEVLDAGDIYLMVADEVHCSTPDDGTVTVCARTFTKKDTERARVYWPRGGTWVSAEPRAATQYEVETITSFARQKLWSLIEG